MAHSPIEANANSGKLLDARPVQACSSPLGVIRFDVFTALVQDAGNIEKFERASHRRRVTVLFGEASVRLRDGGRGQ